MPVHLFTGMGTMEQDWWERLSLCVKEVDRAAAAAEHLRPPATFYTTRNAMLAAIQRLRLMPMTRPDFVLQTAQCQWMALDVDAMTTFLLKVAPLIKKTRVVHQIGDEGMLGCFTNNPTITEMLHRGSVPFWLVRDVRDVPGGTLQVMNVVTKSHKSQFALMEEYFDPKHPNPVSTPFKTIGIFGHQVERIERQRTMGRMYNNLVEFEQAPAGLSDDINPNPPQVSGIRSMVISGDILGDPFEAGPPRTARLRTPTPPRYMEVDHPIDLDQTNENGCPPGVLGTDAEYNPYDGSTPSVAPTPIPRHSPPRSCYYRSPSPSSFYPAALLGSNHLPSGSTQVVSSYAPAGVFKKYRSRKPPRGKGSKGKSCAPPPVNRDKWKPFINSVTPLPSQSWFAALSTVNRNDPIHRDLDKSAAGYMYPDPGLIASFEADKRLQAISLWLAIRTARASQLHKPGSALPRPLSASGWRNFFWITLRHNFNPAQGTVGLPIKEKGLVANAIASASIMFGEADAAAMDVNVAEVCYAGATYPVQQGRAIGITDEIIRVILWELAELNFRYELLVLDHVAAAHKWTEVDADINRKPLISGVFSLDNCFTVEQPFAEENRHIVEEVDLVSHTMALENLRKLMADWRNFPAGLQQPLSQEVQEPEAKRQRQLVKDFYCSSFYRFFGRPPILPQQTVSHS
ncbi:hypothetical protein HWV62_33229 [Athelia sp. TMB]|nr:hypothetical protein HWV62_33229 [Athelia sp. TMB]